MHSPPVTGRSFPLTEPMRIPTPVPSPPRAAVSEQEAAIVDDDELLDFTRLRERLGYVLRAPRRRPCLAASVFVAVGALGIGAACTMPWTYESDLKLLAQRNVIVPALTNPNRSWISDTESPTRNVSSLILRQENLAAVCKDLDLTNRYYGRRSPALRLKDRILGVASTDAERTYSVVGMLRKRLTVQVDDSTVTITVYWPDAQQAYDIVTRVQQSFLEARYDDEIAMVGDAISVLQGHAALELGHLGVALDEYQKLLAERGPRTVAVEPGAAPALRLTGATSEGPPHKTAAAAPDPDLLTSLDDKRRQIRAVEDERQRELAALQQQLTQAEVTLTAQHPVVVALQEQIEPRRRLSPELVQLRQEERSLVAQMAPATSATPLAAYTAGSYAPPRAASGLSVPQVPVLPAAWETDGQAQLAHAKLQAAIRSYEDSVDRLDAANVEMEIAGTTFKYRYTVVTPPEVAKRPIHPTAWILGIGTVPVAILLAVLLAALADVRRGRVLEAWQVRRMLKLDVLGELDA